MKATDWTSYYGKKKSWFSTHTQQYTLDAIENAIRRYTVAKDGEPIRILELGGGNSCFAQQICRDFDVKAYNIIDNNALAVKLFDGLDIPAEEHRGILFNLLGEEEVTGQDYDFVFSIGLIEHFRGEDIRKVINQHYRHCKPQGCVLISFPTPTRRYLITRKLMEKAGMWQFHDELPIRWHEQAEHFERCGRVVSRHVNWKLPLTQLVVVSVHDGRFSGEV